MNPDPLTTQALLGAGRMAALPEAPAPELAGLWPAFDPGNPADSLLRALALTRALHLAGAKPTEVEEENVRTCPDESKPYLSSTMLSAGTRLLDGEFPELLAEWLDAAVASGGIVPPRLLPVLLPLATRHPIHRPAARLLSGERGLWLARHRAEFSWVLEDAPADDSAWDDGQAAERLGWLRHMRSSDPERARAAVAAQWAGEEPSMRERIIRVIAETPSPDDIPFLECEAIKDRRQEVREPALGALLGITDSPLLRRSVDRLRALVRVERKLIRRHLVVEPPASFDPSWAADGIKEKPPQGSGEKAWWLRQLVAMVPLSTWSEMLDLPAADILSFPVGGDWAEPLHLGWMDAARRLSGRTPLRDFIPWLASLDKWPKVAPHPSQLIAQLLDTLPTAEAYQILETIHDRCQPALVLDLMGRCGSAPGGAAQKCLATLRAAVLQTPSPLTRPQARALARCLPAGEIERELRALASAPDLTGSAEEFAATLEIRRLIHPQSASLQAHAPT